MKKNMFKSLQDAMDSITQKLTTDSQPYKVGIFYHRATCRVTYRHDTNLKLLATVDILSLYQDEQDIKPVPTFYTCFW